jgi:ABC-type sugar transport system permease subunit
MQRFFLRKFRFEKGSAWKNPFFALLISTLIFLIFLIGFYNYRSSNMYYDVNLKQGKSVCDTIGFSVLKIKNEILATNFANPTPETIKASEYNKKLASEITKMIAPINSYIDKGLTGTITASNLRSLVSNYSILKGYIELIAKQTGEYIDKNLPRFIDDLANAALVLDPSDETMYLGSLQNSFQTIAREMEFAISKMIYKITKDDFTAKVFDSIGEKVSKEMINNFIPLLPPLNPDEALTREQSKELFMQLKQLITAFLKDNSSQISLRAEIEQALNFLATRINKYIASDLSKGKSDITNSISKIAASIEKHIVMKSASFSAQIKISDISADLADPKLFSEYLKQALDLMKAELSDYINKNAKFFLFNLTMDEIINGMGKADRSVSEILLYTGIDLQNYYLQKGLKVKNYLSLPNAHQLAQRSLENDTVLIQKAETAAIKTLIKAISYLSKEAKFDMGMVKKEFTYTFSLGSKLLFFLMIFIVLCIGIFFLVKKVEKPVLQRILLFVSFGLFTVLSLFLAINFSTADYEIANRDTASYANNNLQIAQKSFAANLNYNFTESDIDELVSLYNRDRYNDVTEGFVYQNDKILETKESHDVRTQENSVFIFLGWFIGLVLGALALLKFTKNNGVERFLNTGYNYTTGYIFVLPGIISMFVLVFFPLIFTFILGFTALPNLLEDLNLARYFTGFSNFGRILGVFQLSDPLNFYYTLFFTIFYTVVAVIIEVVLGVMIAIILNEKGLQLKSAYQVIFILPWIIPTYISGLLWNYFFQPNGILNQVLSVFAGTAVETVWFNDPLTGFFIVSFISAWYAFPFIMLVTLSTLQTIDPSIYEAAMIDGASWFQKMIHITIPMIRSTVLPSVLLTSIWTFNNFNLVYLVTRGDNRYDILVTRIYDYILYPQVAAQQGWTYGFASAYSTLIFIVLLVYIFIFAKATKITEKSF